MFPSISELGMDFISNLLVWNPKVLQSHQKRMSAQRAILHPYFYEKPLPKVPEHINALKKLEVYKQRIRDMIVKKNKN